MDTSSSAEFVAPPLPSTIDECRAQGNAAFTRGDYGGALRLYAQGVAMQSDSDGGDEATRGLIYSNMAEAHLRLLRPIEAIQAAKMAIQRDPDNLKAWHRLGTACFRNRSFHAAQVAFRTALAIQPANAQIRSMLNKTQEILGQASSTSWLSDTHMEQQLTFRKARAQLAKLARSLQPAQRAERMAGLLDGLVEGGLRRKGERDHQQQQQQEEEADEASTSADVAPFYTDVAIKDYTQELLAVAVSCAAGDTEGGESHGADWLLVDLSQYLFNEEDSKAFYDLCEDFRETHETPTPPHSDTDTDASQQQQQQPVMPRFPSLYPTLRRVHGRRLPLGGHDAMGGVVEREGEGESGGWRSVRVRGQYLSDHLLQHVQDSLDDGRFFNRLVDLEADIVVLGLLEDAKQAATDKAHKDKDGTDLWETVANDVACFFQFFAGYERLEEAFKNQALFKVFQEWTKASVASAKAIGEGNLPSATSLLELLRTYPDELDVQAGLFLEQFRASTLKAMADNQVDLAEHLIAQYGFLRLVRKYGAAHVVAFCDAWKALQQSSSPSGGGNGHGAADVWAASFRATLKRHREMHEVLCEAYQLAQVGPFVRVIS
ncbi:unnamed protein product [Vitrella brassicaformis CCMP3155]|uniref:Uncharacterized protein n=2 Tax=Vitrella brassicaformis TaxID=1169539 RepID=A0A0G4E998_VITBC|nr:unnamed protein product [Vitrella brassicaformis CCMP3155]|mmetsp:Transcript_16651/g.47413  ORF Transcript_16651/g.47413 Transcript_16651/m.47413 type:complete len:602 (+) Transcript_16651:57-1862(+)|eukprot:CEL91933.1 unnamed protein product [Vitrella brassicaformis CCMP3155]